MGEGRASQADRQRDETPGSTLKVKRVSRPKFRPDSKDREERRQVKSKEIRRLKISCGTAHSIAGSLVRMMLAASSTVLCSSFSHGTMSSISPIDCPQDQTELSVSPDSWNDCL